MVDVALIYPYFYHNTKDKSIFKFPPLGLGYLASSLEKNDISVELIDGTFASPVEIIERVKTIKPLICGFYCMVTLEYSTKNLIEEVKKYSRLTIAGGPYPSASPATFLPDFDLVAVGEGEITILELIKALDEKRDLLGVNGIARANNGDIIYSKPRDRIENLDMIHFPDRAHFDNKSYQYYWRNNYDYTNTSIITSRGCPFSCGFCSKPVFGDQYKERSAKNIVNEIEEIMDLGYERVWIADDCFTLNKLRVKEVCFEIIKRDLDINWECLSRVDGINPEMLELMREAGCIRIFFGLESGNNDILNLMKKNITIEAGMKAVELVRQAKIKSGGFFILGYPGETDDTLLDTINFSSSLPLDYLSYTVPYPLPGTDLYQKVRNHIKNTRWDSPKNHKLLFKSDFSQLKIKFAMAKGLLQHKLQYKWSKALSITEPLFRKISNYILRLLR